MRILPPKRKLIQLLGISDFFLWQYYGEGILGRIQAWIFRSRIKALMKFLRRSQLKPRRILDIGCGPMFISYALINNPTYEYVGVDIMFSDKSKKYRDAMRKLGVGEIGVVRASAEQLPLRGNAFDLSFCLDVLEHLSKPREGIMEIYKVTKNGGKVAMSLPLENLFQRLARIGFRLMKLVGDPILKKAERVPRAHHYVGDIKSYGDMVRVLKEQFSLLQTEYTPIGFLKSININAVHILQRSN